MNEALPKYTVKMLLDMLNATSLPASESGPMPCDKQAGRTTDQFGPAHAPASLSAPQESAKALTMNDTCGLSFTGSSASAVLTQSLVSRLRVKTDSLGSTLYKLTWKERITPSGRSIPALRASVRRTSDKDCTGWPTPCAQPAGGSAEACLMRKEAALKKGSPIGGCMDLALIAQMAGWPTPQATDWKHSTGETRNDKQLMLGNVAGLAGWPTPTTRDHKDGAESNVSTNALLGRTVWLAGWSTPTTMEHLPPRNPATFYEWNNARDGRKNRMSCSLRQQVTQFFAEWGDVNHYAQPD